MRRRSFSREFKLEAVRLIAHMIIATRWHIGEDGLRQVAMLIKQE